MIELSLPPPPSVNRTRKIDWSAYPALKAWKRTADGLTMIAWSGGRRPKPIPNQFEVTIIVSENVKIDLDNGPKRLIDYAKQLELIIDDSPRYMRRVIIEWGHAPEGCRLILRPL